MCAIDSDRSELVRRGGVAVSRRDLLSDPTKSLVELLHQRLAVLEIDSRLSNEHDDVLAQIERPFDVELCFLKAKDGRAKGSNQLRPDTVSNHRALVDAFLGRHDKHAEDRPCLSCLRCDGQRNLEWLPTGLAVVTGRARGTSRCYW